MMYNQSQSYFLPLSILSIPFLSEVVAVGNVVLVAIDVDVLADDKVFWFYHLALEGFVLASLEEFASPETVVFGRVLVDLEAVVIQEISDDELSFAIFRFG